MCEAVGVVGLSRKKADLDVDEGCSGGEEEDAEVAGAPRHLLDLPQH